MTEKNSITKEDAGLIDRMFAAGAHYGFLRSRRHPSARPFLFGTKDKVEIINLEKTLDALKEAEEFVASLAASGKKVLFIGTKNEGRRIIKGGAKAIGMPYVDIRWIGGIFSNFSEIKRRIDWMKTLEDRRERGELQKYTKKERLLFDREIEDLERNFGGLRDMDTLPAAVFILDVRHEEIALKEARKSKIPVISLSSSDCDFRGIDYPLPANDSSVASITFFVDRLVEAYKAGKMSAKPAQKEAGSEK